MIERQFNRQCHIAVMLWLVLCIAVGCVVPPSPVPPRPDPVPVVDDVDAALIQVVIDYAGACGDSLTDTASGDTEADYNAALRAARSRGRVAAHGPEDALLAKAAGDPAKVREIGEAWLRVQKRLEGMK